MGKQVQMELYLVLKCVTISCRAVRENTFLLVNYIFNTPLSLILFQGPNMCKFFDMSGSEVRSQNFCLL